MLSMSLVLFDLCRVLSWGFLLKENWHRWSEITCKEENILSQQLNMFPAKIFKWREHLSQQQRKNEDQSSDCSKMAASKETN